MTSCELAVEVKLAPAEVFLLDMFWWVAGSLVSLVLESK